MYTARSFGAFVAVLRDALSTIQLRPVGGTLHDHVVLAVGIPAFPQSLEGDPDLAVAEVKIAPAPCCAS